MYLSLVIVAILIISTLAIGFALSYWIRCREIKSVSQQLEMFASKYCQAYGWHEWFGIYDLESFDGGKLWYSMATGPNGLRIVRGLAETVYPGLLCELQFIQRNAPAHEVQPIARPYFEHILVTDSESDSESSRPARTAEDIYESLAATGRRQGLCMKLPVLPS